MLGVNRPSVSNLVNEKAAMIPVMALRIAKVFGGTSDLWIRMQANYDIKAVQKKSQKS